MPHRGCGRWKLLCDLERNDGLASYLDLGEVKILIVREFVDLSDFGAEDAHEMLGVGSGEFGGAAMDLGDEEAASGHKLPFYETNFLRKAM